MANLETKIIKVQPSEEESAIRFMQIFKWDLINNQEVYNKNTRMEDDFWTEGINVITETTHYVKLTFRRDTNIPCYLELIKYENEYRDLLNIDKPKKFTNRWDSLFGICFIFIGSFGTLLGLISLNPGIFIHLLLFVYGIYLIKSAKKSIRLQIRCGMKILYEKMKL